jgi:hypothetical protein
MKGNILIVDKKTEFNTFRYEEKIKSPQFKEGIDYTVDGVMYSIFSPQLRKDILIIQNPYHVNIDVSDILSMRILVDRQDGINIKPKIVTDLEQREGLIEVGRGINNFPKSLPPSREEQAIEDRKLEITSSSQIQEIDDKCNIDEDNSKVEQKTEKNQALFDAKKTDDSQKSNNNNLFTSLLLGGLVLLATSYLLVLVVRKYRKR